MLTPKLSERVHGELPGPLEPLLVGGPRERGEQRVAVAGRAVADRRALLDPVRACPPGQLRPAENERLGQVVRGCRDHSRRSVAPLEPDRAVARRQLRAVDGRPVDEPVLDDRSALEDHVRLPFERRALALGKERRERPHVADEPVYWAEVPTLMAVQPLPPETVRLTARSQNVRALLPGVDASARRPSSGASPRPRAVSPGCPTSSRPPRSCRSGERARAVCRRAPALGRSRHATSRIPVSPPRSDDFAGSGSSILMRSGLARNELEGAERKVCEVEARLGVAATLESAERPQDAGRSGVHVLQRARRLPAIPVVGAPEQLRATERRVGLRDDLADRVAGGRIVPRLVSESLECLGLVEQAVRRRRGRGRRRRGRAASSGPDARSDGCAHA